jgi:hypothetical protein
MDHKLGRQFYGNPGDLVIYYGPKMWPYQKILAMLMQLMLLFLCITIRTGHLLV